jgi:hypothetical protein
MLGRDDLVNNLELAIVYYNNARERCEKEMGTYLPGNLVVCKALLSLLQKRNFEDDDYKAVRDTTLALLKTKFHEGMQMEWIVKAIDRWLSESWKDFEEGTVIGAFKGVF